MTTQRVTVETAGTECCNLFGQPSRHATCIARSCSMCTSQSVGKSAHSSPDSRHPGGVGKTPFRAPHPVLLASTVFEVRVAAVIQHKIVLVKPDFAQSAKLEVQQRLWPGRGGQQRSRRKWSGGDTRRASRSLKWKPSSRF